jgi:O-antigen/teichoic acid export membrane protein
LLGVARQYRDLPKYNLWTTLIDLVSAGLPLWCFSAVFSPGVAAQYALANTVLRAPGALLGQSVSQVFYERTAREAANSEALSRLLRRNIYLLSSVGAPFVLCILVAGPWLFKLIFGSQWATAGSFARALVFLAATSLVSSPLSVLTIVLNRQREYFWIIALVAATRSASVAIGAWLRSPMIAVALLAASEGAVYVLFLVWLDRTVRMPRVPDSTAAGSAMSLGEPTT